MKFKFNFYCMIIIGLSIYSCTGERNELKKQINISESVLMKIGDYSLTEDKFKERIEKVKSLRYYGDTEISKAIREAWDISIKLGLFIAESYRIGIDKDPNLISVYKEAKSKVFEKYIKMIPEKYFDVVTDKLVKEGWQRRNRLYYIGHIWVRNKEDVNLIIKKLEIGMRITDLLFDRTIKGLNIKEIEQKNVTGGEFLPEIERALCKMNVGEWKVIKTKSGYHIIILEEIGLRDREPLNRVNDLIRENIARAYFKESGIEHLHKIAAEEIWIDETKLAYLDVFNNAVELKMGMYEDQRTIVKLKRGDTITVTNVKNSILKLSPNDLNYFRDKNTRDRAIKNFIVRMPNTVRYFEKKMKESLMVEELLKQEILPNIKIEMDGREILEKSKETGLDIRTVSYQVLMEKQNEYLSQFLKLQIDSNVENINKRLINLAYEKGINESVLIKKRMEEYKNRIGHALWNSEIRADLINEFIFIDSDLIQQIILNVYDDIQIATCNMGEITFKEFRYNLSGYPNSTLQQLRVSEKLKKMALYRIVEEKYPRVDLASIKVNKQAFQQFDPLGDTRRSDLISKPVISNDEIIAKYGDHIMTVGELINLIKSWPGEKINRFRQHRFTVLKKYLEDLLWSEKAAELGLDQDLRVKVECSYLKEWLMLERFYNKFIYITPIFTENGYLKEWLSRFVASMEDNKLRELKEEFRKKYQIQVNKKLMEEIGLQIEPDFVCF